MNKKHKVTKRPAAPGVKPAHPGGFWDRTDPKPSILSVRHSSSRSATSIAFLRRIVGWGRKDD